MRRPFQLDEKVSPGLSRAAALDFQSRAATCAVQAKSLAAQGFLYTERWPRHRRKRDVQSSIKWHLPLDRQPEKACVRRPFAFHLSVQRCNRFVQTFCQGENHGAAVKCGLQDSIMCLVVMAGQAALLFPYPLKEGNCYAFFQCSFFF